MESYSSSIQKIGVFVNSSLEMSSGGISYFNTFLIDLTNSILIESINQSNQLQQHNNSNSSSNLHQNTKISMEGVQEAVNSIFPYEMSEYIIDQAQGRIQHTSMRNLPLYQLNNINNNNNNNNNSNNGNMGGSQIIDHIKQEDYLGNQDISNNNKIQEELHQQQQQQQQDELDDDDEDFDGFEIIPRDTATTAHNISLFYPIDLVFQVTQEMIKRKKLIKETTFYDPIEIQSKDSYIFTFLSYCMESVTTRILKKLSDTRVEINEDIIRKTITDDHCLKEIRHKVVQITNITNRLLSNGGTIADLSTSLNTSSIFSSSSSSSSNSSSILYKLSNTNEINNNNNINNESNNNNNVNEPIIVNNNNNNNNNNNSQNNDTTINTEETNNLNNSIPVQDTVSSPITIPTPTTITTTTTSSITPIPTTTQPTPEKKIIEEKKVVEPAAILPEISKRMTKSELDSLLGLIPTTDKLLTTTTEIPDNIFDNRPIKIPRPAKFISLVSIKEPGVDLLEILREGHFYFEAKNGSFLIFLILLGLAIQSMCEVY